MGRRYFGDIEGKCWFGVQPSNWADRFGCSPTLTYFFDEDNLETINNVLSEIETALGENLKKLDTFFDENECYSDERLAKYLGILNEDLIPILEDYADYKSGLQIKECLEREGSCQFKVEL